MPGVAVRRVAATVAAWSPEERDAVLYAASALFAVVTAQASGLTLYRQWGEIAVGPYAAGAVASAVMAARARRAAAVPAAGPALGGAPPPGLEQPPAAAHPEASAESGSPAAADEAAEPARHRSRGPSGWHWTGPRATIFLLVLIGATLLPLSLEVLWRSDSAPGTAHVQPEVEVVEHAGTRVVDGKDPYQHLNPRHLPPVAAGEPSYDAFNPYLPLMSVFGLARSTKLSPRLTDARIGFSLVTILVVMLALGLTRGPTGPRVLALQTMTVLPTAALPLATGGDDVPVAAMMLLGLVLLVRRRPLAAGLALGVGASMKITAWPLAALALLVACDGEGRRTPRSRMLYGVGFAAVFGPTVVPWAIVNFGAFVENVVRFPLGLAGVTSPAASPLLGHALVTAFPHFHRAFTLIVAAGGVVVLGWVLLRHRPRMPSELSRLLGWVMTVAILLAPATRIGYLLYPVDFFIWVWLLRGEQAMEGPPAAEASDPAADPVAGDEPAAALVGAGSVRPDVA